MPAREVTEGFLEEVALGLGLILIGKHKHGMGALVSGTRESRDRGAEGRAAGSPPFHRVHSGCPY